MMCIHLEFGRGLTINQRIPSGIIFPFLRKEEMGAKLSSMETTISKDGMSSLVTKIKNTLIMGSFTPTSSHIQELIRKMFPQLKSEGRTA